MLAKKSSREGGFATYSKEELLADLGRPLSAKDYSKADRVTLLLMQPQVGCLLNAEPAGNKKESSCYLKEDPNGIFSQKDSWRR